MSHMVIYRGSDGKPGYHQTDDIHDAVGFVEQMRNDQGVEHARIFRLEEVVFQYKPYYRVELAESGFAELATATGELPDTGRGNGSGAHAAVGATNGSGNGSTGADLSTALKGKAADGTKNGTSATTPTARPTGPATSSASASGSMPSAPSAGPISSASPSPSASGSVPPSAIDDEGGPKRGLFGR